MRRCLIVLVFCVSVLLPALAAWSQPPVNKGPKVCNVRGEGECSECTCPKYKGRTKANEVCQRESCGHAFELHFSSSAGPERK